MFSFDSTVFDSVSLHSKVVTHVSSDTYNLDVVSFINVYYATLAPRYGRSGNVDIAASVYLYPILTTVLTTTDALVELRRTSTSVELPLFNISLLRCIAMRTSANSGALGRLTGTVEFGSLDNILNMIKSLDHNSDLACFNTSYFSTALPTASDRHRFIDAVKSIADRCFKVNDGGKIGIDYVSVCLAIKTCTHSLSTRWECEPFLATEIDSSLLSVHRFRGEYENFLCERAGIENISQERFDCFIFFLKVFKPSFTISTNGTDFNATGKVPIAGDCFLNTDTITLTSVWNVCLTYVKVLAKPVTKQESKSSSNKDHNVHLVSGNTNFNEIRKRDFSSSSRKGIDTVAFVSKYSLIPRFEGDKICLSSAYVPNSDVVRIGSIYT